MQLQQLSTLLLYAVLAAVSYAAAFALRFGGVVPPQYVDVLIGSIGLATCAKLAACYWFGLHKGFSRYLSFDDLIVIGKATTLGSIALTFADALLMPLASLPRGVLVIDWGATLMTLGLVRAAPRALRHFPGFAAAGRGPRALIVGADDDGEALLRALRGSRTAPRRVVGFLDADPRRQGRRIGGVPVLGAADRLSYWVARLHIEEVLISGGMNGRDVRMLVDAAEQCGVRVCVLPSYDRLLQGSVAVQPRPVAIEDLLRRDPVQLDQASLHGFVGGQTVLVTGSAGSIGSELCRQLLALGPKRLVLVDRSETGQFFLERELTLGGSGVEVTAMLADMTDVDRLRVVFDQTRPDVVFHAAAYKHVPLMESHPGEGIKNIVLATRNVAELAHEFDCGTLVMISTDKAVNPTSVMGSCKKLAERYVQARAAAGRRFITVRFGNVLDSAGSVVPIFRQQIAAGGPITITHPDIVRYFMMIPEAAQLVIQAGALGAGGEIFVLDMGEPVRIVDLARDMIHLSGLREGEDIEIEVVGLRPGEKLYEELYGDEETHAPTSHPKIMAAASAAVSLLKVTRDINRLEALANAPADVVRAALGEVVPRLESQAAERRAA
ncbi:UDP-N-acetyl-alpha-D-glucosamine C6 dehydratase [Pirellulimonas nuda]|uniref:UDP-N-acetyl-alpha-D-glucosamine C6 dehydratase n=1 Tax=Pirellulimonas nuda TaxID=2528009 RepID=A0A518D7E4_9BACT|nr:nucleoside-diphosphate sugar epimerase/dehydratase [Pirellulimonas nuda]QDU87403.1 UDP-N-acetyl-alpha-D-glucosamine C6 dehydratase [Pirellulimonas nuda]